MKSARNDIILSVVLLLVAGFVFIQSSQFPETAARFSRLFAGILAFLTLILLFRSIITIKGLKESGEDDEEEKSLQDYKNPTLIVIGLLVYVAILDTVGYVISTFLISMYVIYILGYRDIKKMSLTSGLGVLVCYVVFKVLLGVRLPEIAFLL